MKRKEVEQLLERYRLGTCTPEDIQLLEIWFNHQLEALPLEEDLDWDKLEVEIWDRIAPEKSISFRRWLPYVAAVLIAIAGGVWLFFESTNNYGEAPEILPGGNRATLTLSGGKILELDGQQSGIIISDSAILYRDGLVANPILDRVSLSSIDTLVLTTPRGGMYQVTLPDGTEVWLNASSELRYPIRFDDEMRVVSLVGEAFFDVRPLPLGDGRADGRGSMIPFRVKTSGQTVEVLGTSFNLSAYPNDDNTATTLLTGKVQVLPVHIDAGPVVLTPGMQSRLRNGRIQVEEVNTATFTAWKTGVFQFDQEALGSIMRKIERWYDIEAMFTDKVESLQFSGTISRYANGKEVLDMLSATGAFQYEIQGKQVIIRENKALKISK